VTIYIRLNAALCGMADLDDRIAALSERISRSALLYIHKLRDHPKISELLTELEVLTGSLIETDIDQAFRRVLIWDNPA
jgi:hypothetical protein